MLDQLDQFFEWCSRFQVIGTSLYILILLFGSLLYGFKWFKNIMIISIITWIILLIIIIPIYIIPNLLGEG